MTAGSASAPVVVPGAASGRPLVIPLASAVAGELRGIEPRTLLYDAGRLSRLVEELTLSLGADAAVVEFGSWWDVEAAGHALDWSGGLPSPPAGPLALPDALDLGAGRAPVVLEALRRLRGTLGERAQLAAGVTGPATWSALSGGSLPPSRAAALLVPVVRALCEAGAGIVWVVETVPPPEGLAAAVAPLWGTARFFGATPVLHLSGDADAWEPLLARGGGAVACFDPEAAPALAARFAKGGEFGLALPPATQPSERARALVASGHCRIVTHTHELAGTVRAAELPDAVAALRGLVGGAP